MNPLQRRLLTLRIQMKLVTLARGCAGGLAVLAGAALLVGLADYSVVLPTLVRAFLLVATLGGAALVFWQTLLAPLWHRSDDLSLALRVEREYPELNDALASAVEFLDGAAEQNSSKALRERALEQAAAATENCNFQKVLDLRGFAVVLGLALVAILPGLVLYWNNAPMANIALARFFDPFGTHTWTQLQVADIPPRVAQGQPLAIKGDVAGIIPSQVRVEIEGTIKSDMQKPVKLALDKQSGKFVVPLDMTAYKGAAKIKFRVTANDAVYPRRGLWQEVEVLPPPKFAMLDGLPSPQVELLFPGYTDKPPQKVSPGQGHVEAVAGTHVTLRAAVDRPLAEAWFELFPAQRTRTLAWAAPLGQMGPLGMASVFSAGQAIAGRFPCVLDDSRTLLTAQFTAWAEGAYALRLKDQNGLVKDYAADLRIFADPPPVVHLQRPAASMSLLPDAVVNFKIVVEDELFAVRSVHLEYRRKNAEGKWLDEDLRQSAIFEPTLIGRDLPQALARLGGMTITGAQRLRPKRLELLSRWPLLGLVQEGDTVYLQIVADDYNDLFNPRAQGRSHAVELRIVGKRELARQLDDEFGKIHQDLLQLQQWQQEALEKVQHVKNNPDKPGPQNHELVVDAEQKQKAILGRIGQVPEEGMRKEIATLQQKIRDNRLPPGDLQDRLKVVKTELDRLAEETLPKIDNQLVEARKEMAGLAKPAPKGQEPLTKAEVSQKEAKQTIDELIRFLDPWTKMNVVKGQIQDILQQEKDIKKGVQNVQNQLDKDPGNQDLKNELDKHADAQQRLAGKTQELIQRLQDVKDKQKDNDTGKKAGDAADVANQSNPDQGPLPKEMKDAADNLRNQAPDKALQKQNNAIDRLEKMMQALEEKRDEDIDKLLKKQKQAEAKLDELRNKTDELNKKIKKAGQIADPKERERELKKLAKEQEKLKDEAQEQARELARLRADQASREMARAAGEMERAVRQLDNGDVPPEQAQEEILDRIEAAQDRLDEAEDELAREQLARIADQLKALKERQDAAIDSSARLHAELKRRNQWARGMIDTLKNSATAQDNLRKEADNLREKLKDAKVFAHILEKAAVSMEKAKEAILERKENIAADKLTKEEWKDENAAQEKIVGLQKDASARLQRLLEALKNDPILAQNDNNNEPGGEPMPPDGDMQQGGFRPGDGIPPNAQIKALRDEQTDLKKRTEDFARKHPDPMQLTPEQQAELRLLHEEQAMIHQLFNQITGQKGN